MSAHFIPPKDPNEQRLEQIKSTLSEVLRPYVKGGQKKDAVLEAAVADAIAAIRPLLKLQNPTHGATVMTEAASQSNRKGPRVI